MPLFSVARFVSAGASFEYHHVDFPAINYPAIIQLLKLFPSTISVSPERVAQGIPSVMDQFAQISPALYTSLSPTVTETTFHASPVKSEDGSTADPPKKKQKRNKPTLSCEECVERKTKVSKHFKRVEIVLTPLYQAGREQLQRNGDHEVVADQNIAKLYFFVAISRIVVV
jgi:hypothetical protein